MLRVIRLILWSLGNFHLVRMNVLYPYVLVVVNTVSREEGDLPAPASRFSRTPQSLLLYPSIDLYDLPLTILSPCHCFKLFTVSCAHPRFARFYQTPNLNGLLLCKHWHSTMDLRVLNLAEPWSVAGSWQGGVRSCPAGVFGRKLEIRKT